MGSRLLTRVFPDRGRQLERIFQCRAVVRQLQQRGVEHEHEHRGSPRERISRTEAGRLRVAGQRQTFGVAILTRHLWRDKDEPQPAASICKRQGMWSAAFISSKVVAKTYGSIYDQIIDFDNIWAAYHAARLGKRFQREVAGFNANAEENLINIHNHLAWNSWRPGKAREFRVYEPKWRDIQAPPFEDRIVHHALVRVVEPLFEKRFIHHSYACRTDKGAQRAVSALQVMLREAAAKYQQPYVIKADISKYFASIDQNILFSAIERVISCNRTLMLWRRIARAYGHQHGIGLPVGALTSQLSANIMLDQLDHAITDDAGLGRYVRYMDDFIIVAPCKAAAQAILIHVADEVEALGLRLNPKTAYFPLARGVDFAGYRIWPTHILPRKRNIKKARLRFKKMAAQYKDGRIGLDYIQPRVSSFLAYTKHCQAEKTVAGVLSDFTLTRS